MNAASDNPGFQMTRPKPACGAGTIVLALLAGIGLGMAAMAWPDIVLSLVVGGGLWAVGFAAVLYLGERYFGRGK